MYQKETYCLLVFFLLPIFFAQENSVYSDYLSDNYYLLHPSMAGAANCSKIRLTARNNGLKMLSFTNTQL
jgi:hypothetical protein